MKTHPAIVLPAVVLAVSCTVHAQGNDGYSRRSLVGLAGVQVMATLSLSPGMARVVTDVELEVEAERVLKRAGINIVGREKPSPLPGMPILFFRVQAVKSAEQPLNAFSIESGVAQKVQLERDNSISVDAVTWSVYALAVIDSSNVKQAALASIDRAADEFITAYREHNPKR
jgi:hypothetical protein